MLLVFSCTPTHACFGRQSLSGEMETQGKGWTRPDSLSFYRLAGISLKGLAHSSLLWEEVCHRRTHIILVTKPRFCFPFVLNTTDHRQDNILLCSTITREPNPEVVPQGLTISQIYFKALSYANSLEQPTFCIRQYFCFCTETLGQLTSSEEEPGDIFTAQGESTHTACSHRHRP